MEDILRELHSEREWNGAKALVRADLRSRTTRIYTMGDPLRFCIPHLRVGDVVEYKAGGGWRGYTATEEIALAGLADALTVFRDGSMALRLVNGLGVKPANPANAVGVIDIARHEAYYPHQMLNLENLKPYLAQK